MKVVTIDLETYYDQEFSLSKMTTEAYVRDPRFEVIGVGVKIDNGDADWYSGSDPGKFLRSLDYGNAAILCHNTAFDGAILSWHYGIRPKLWLDTLSMGRAVVGGRSRHSLDALSRYFNLGAKGTEVQQALGKRRADFTPKELAQYGQYCINDVELTYKLYKVLLKVMPLDELIVIDQIIRMFTEVLVELDTDLLTIHLAEIRNNKAALLQTLADQMGVPVAGVAEQLMSNDKLAALLRARGVEPPMKRSLRTSKQTYAFAKTDKEFLALKEHEDPEVQAIVEARLGTKSTLEETRTEALLGVASRGNLPIMLNYYGAHTGRLSGGDGLNLQNFPSRGGNNTLRRALLAPQFHRLLSCDLSQIEARIIAWLAKQNDLLHTFATKGDPYCDFASLVYDRKITKDDKVERFVGKTAVLSLGYGAGAAKFREMLRVQGHHNIPEEEAERIVSLYRAQNGNIVKFWHHCADAVYRMQGHNNTTMRNGLLLVSNETIRLPNGLSLQYPCLHRTEGVVTEGYGASVVYAGRPAAIAEYTAARLTGDPVNYSIGWVKLYGGKLAENITQALAALLVRQYMAEAAIVGLQVAFQVHDEIIVVSREDRVDHDAEVLTRIMSTPPSWAPDLPVACELGVAVNYGET